MVKTLGTITIALILIIALVVVFMPEDAVATNTQSVTLNRAGQDNAFITDAAQTGLDITGDMTIESWVNFTTVPTNVTYAFVGKNAAAPNRGYTFGLRGISAGVTVEQLGLSSTGSDNSAASVSWVPTTGTWYHAAVVYDSAAGSATFYVNAAQQGNIQTGLVNSQFNNATNFRIGDDDGNLAARAFDGEMDEVRIYNRALSAAEILADYNCQLLSPNTGLQGYWELNGDYTDASGNANTLTPSGSPTFTTDVPFSADCAAPPQPPTLFRIRKGLVRVQKALIRIR